MAKHYYISFNGGGAWSEIFPSNEPEAIQNKEVGTQVWREEVDELKLPKTSNSAVYDTLHSYFIDKTKFDDEVEIEIYEGIRTTGVLYWQGLFSISDTKDDFEKTTVILNPLRINDDYRTILEQSERQIELDAGGRAILEGLRVGYSEAIVIGPAWTNPAVGGYDAIDTLNATAGTIGTAIALGAADVEAASVILPALADDDIVIVDVSAYTRNSGAQPMFDIHFGAGAASMTDEGFKTIVLGTMGYTMSSSQAAPRLVMKTQEPPNGAFNMNDIIFTMRKVAATNDKSLAGRLLMRFLNTFISSATYMGIAAYNGNVVSTFFNNDALPTGAPSSITTIMTAEPNGNYVTETVTNELKYTVAGLLKEWFDITDSVSCKLSFNDIMGQLREMFQVYWFIDADDKFRVEHDRYFVAQVADSTPIVLDTQDEIDAREFNYNKGQIASTETFAWAQSANEDFVGADIIYNNFETTNNSIEHSANYITTDIKYVIDNIDDASKNGLGIYQCNLIDDLDDGVDMYEINIATGALSGAAISNAEFSWANLHDKYWSWSRMAEDATVNGGAETMDSAIRFLEQSGIRFFYSTAIDPYTMITARLTGAAPISISRSLETDYVTLLLGYDPYKL